MVAVPLQRFNTAVACFILKAATMALHECLKYGFWPIRAAMTWLWRRCMRWRVLCGSHWVCTLHKRCRCGGRQQFETAHY